MATILVPVNFSANSKNAAHYAADLALATGAAIHLLYSFQIPISMSEVPMPEPVFEELLESGLDQLKTLAAALAKQTAGKVAVSTEMQIGTVEGCIAKSCLEKEPLLVVMGATGKGIENALTGSNTVRAVRHLPYPVLVVPEDAAYRPIQKVVVACDREDMIEGLPAATPVLRKLSETPGIRLEVVHVINGQESATQFTTVYNQWKNDLKGLQPELHFVRGTSIEEGLTNYLKDVPADLLLVFPKYHGWLEFHRSHAKRIVMHCPVPVMSVHE